MAIEFYPKAGAILICNFDGYQEPEIIKKRAVIVISPIHIERRGLLTVVPLSTTVPAQIEKYHYQFKKNPIPNSNYFGKEEVLWVKCDMIATVNFKRLDRIHIGGGKYVGLTIEYSELAAIKKCIKYSLGLD